MNTCWWKVIVCILVFKANHNCRTLTSQNNNNKNRLRNCIVCHSYSGDLCPMPIFSRSTCLLFGFCGSCLRWLVGNNILNSELITIAIMLHSIARFRFKEENSVCVFCQIAHDSYEKNTWPALGACWMSKIFGSHYSCLLHWQSSFISICLIGCSSHWFLIGCSSHWFQGYSYWAINYSSFYIKMAAFCMHFF